MTPERAIELSRAGRLLSVYLVTGSEAKLQSDVVRALRSAALEGSVPGLNEDQLDASDCGVDAALSAARTPPMMGPRRFVLVRNVEKWDGQDRRPAALDRLVAYAEDPMATTVLVLSAAKLDGRRKLVTVSKSGDWLVACDTLSRSALPSWLERRAQEAGHQLTAGVSQLIAELCGPEVATCADALERVCLYAGGGQTVTEEHVAACLIRLRTATVWELVAAVGRQDRGSALAALDEVYDPQDRGLRLVGVLAWSARQLIKFEAARRAGAPPAEAAKKAGAPPFKANELEQQVRRIPRRGLERWLETLAGVDLALKGGSKRPPKAILEHAVIELCKRSG